MRETSAAHPPTGSPSRILRRTVLAAFLVCLLCSTVVGASARVLSVNTTAADPSRAGQSIEVELKTIAMGVSASSNTLARARGNVGEVLELTGVDTPIRRPVEMRVSLSEGAFYRVLSRRELEEGSVDLPVRSVGDGQALRVVRNMIQIQPVRGRLMVREVQILNNGSNQYAPAGSYRVKMPEHAARLNLKAGFGGEKDIRRGENEFEYDLMVAPGRTVLAFYYFIQTEDNSYDMIREVTVPTQQYVLSLPALDELTVSGKNLRRNEGQAGPQGTSTLQFAGRDLSPGTVVGVRFEGLQDIQGMAGMPSPGSGPTPPSSTNPPSGSGNSRPTSVSTTSWPLILGIVFSVLVFVGSYGYVQYRVSNAGAGPGEESFLIDEIARLDQEFEDGAIDRPFYRRTRRRWKKALEESRDEPSET